tara:strand:- start:359 stop:577 length:219 start_codon:yes stop_codon:yes gene_type:complete
MGKILSMVTSFWRVWQMQLSVSWSTMHLVVCEHSVSYIANTSTRNGTAHHLLKQQRSPDLTLRPASWELERT